MNALFSNEKTDFQFYLLDIDHADKYAHGVHEVIDSKGRVIITGKYIDGEREGNWEFFDFNQNVNRNIVFEKGDRKSESYTDMSSGRALSGLYYTRSKNGNVIAKIKVKNGLRHGNTVIYHSNGEIKEVNRYDKGVLLSE